MRFALIIVLSFLTFLGFSQTSDLLQKLDSADQDKIQLSDDAYFDLLDKLVSAYLYNQPDSSLYYAVLSYEFAQERSMQKAVINSLFSIGRTHYVKGEFNEANRYYSQGLEKSLTFGDALLISQGYSSMGVIVNSQGKHNDAIALHKKGVAIARTIPDTTLIIRNSFNISVAYDNLESYDSALYYVDQVIKMALRTNDGYHLAMAYNRRGIIYNHLGDYGQSIQDHQSSLEVVSPTNEWEICFSYSSMADAFVKAGDYDQALDYGVRSLEIAQKMGAKWELERITGFMANAYEGKRDYQNAYKYHKMYKAFSDSVYNEEKEQEMNALHLERVQYENLTLQQQNTLQQDKITRSRLIMLVIFVLLLAVLVIGYLIYRKSEERRKYNLELLEKGTQIQEQKKELEDLIKTKDKILSIIAHDMKSPINSLLAMIYELKELMTGNSELMEIARHSEKQVVTINEVMENLLGWAQDQYEGEKLNPMLIDLSAVVQEMIDFWSNYIGEKQLKVEFDSNVRAMVRADLNHVCFVIRNILGNAVKFTPSEGRIIISFAQTQDEIVTTIEDTGVGIDKAQLAKLFISHVEPQSGTNDEKGIGLGLLLCKEYIEINAGLIQIDSTLGKGTSVALSLPKVEM